MDNDLIRAVNKALANAIDGLDKYGAYTRLPLDLKARVTLGQVKYALEKVGVKSKKKGRHYADVYYFDHNQEPDDPFDDPAPQPATSTQNKWCPPTHVAMSSAKYETPD